MDFEVNLVFLIKPFFSTWPKSHDKNLSILRMERAFKVKEIKRIFHYFSSRAFSYQKLCQALECTFNYIFFSKVEITYTHQISSNDKCNEFYLSMHTRLVCVCVLHPLLFPLSGGRTRALSIKHKLTKLILQIRCPFYLILS